MTVKEHAGSAPSVKLRIESSFGRVNIALLLIVAAFLLGACALMVYKPSTELFAGLNPHLIRMESVLWGGSPADRRAFLFAHKVYFLILVFGSALFALMPASKKRICERSIPIGFQSFAFKIFFASLLGFSVSKSENLWQLIFGLGIAALAFLCLKAKALPSALVLSVVCFLIMTAILPGFLLRPDWSGRPPIEVLQIQQHYAMCVGFADKLTHGIKLDPQTSLFYGVAVPSIVGLVQRVTGILSFLSLIHLVQFFQISLLLTVFCLLSKVCRKHAGLALSGFLLVLPWNHFHQFGLNYPNQSAWRYLAAFLFLFSLNYVRRLPANVACLFFGLSSSLAVLYNVETGLTLFIASLLSIFLLRKRFANGLREIARNAFSYGLGSLLPVVAYVLVFTLLTGYYPSFLSPDKISIYLRAAETISMNGIPSAAAVLIFAQASYCFVSIFLLDSEKVNFRHALRMSVALLIMLWQLYYFNRPYPSNLAMVWALYSVLFVDSLRAAQLHFRRAGNKWKAAVLVPLLSVLAVVSTDIVSTYRTSMHEYALPIISSLSGAASHNARTAEAKELVSGVFLPGEMGRFVLDKAGYYKQLASTHKCNFVSIYSLLIPKLSKMEQSFPFEDPFFGINLEKDYESYIDALLAAKSEYVLLDDWQSDPVLNSQFWYISYSNAVKHRICAAYEFIDLQHGWEVWKLKQAGAKIISAELMANLYGKAWTRAKVYLFGKAPKPVFRSEQEKVIFYPSSQQDYLEVPVQIPQQRPQEKSSLFSLYLRRAKNCGDNLAAIIVIDSKDNKILQLNADFECADECERTFKCDARLSCLKILIIGKPGMTVVLPAQLRLFRLNGKAELQP